MPAIGTRGNCAHGCMGIRFLVPIPDSDAMPATVACELSRSTTYDRRITERTLLYRAVQTHLATWLALRGTVAEHPRQRWSSANSAAISNAASSPTALPAPAAANVAATT